MVRSCVCIALSPLNHHSTGRPFQRMPLLISIVLCRQCLEVTKQSPFLINQRLTRLVIVLNRCFIQKQKKVSLYIVGCGTDGVTAHTLAAQATNVVV